LSLLYLEEKQSPRLTGLYLSITPVFGPDNLHNVPEKYREYFLSREQNKDAPSLGADGIELFFGTFILHIAADSR
jgi:hypothetical protein